MTGDQSASTDRGYEVAAGRTLLFRNSGGSAIELSATDA